MKYKRTQNGIDIYDLHSYDKKTVESFLDDYYQSKKNKYLLIQNKQILVNDVTIKNTHGLLHKEDTLTILIPEEEIDWAFAKKECSVIYEDDFLYIVHKEPGIIIHSSPNETNCLNAMAATYQKNHDILSPVRPIHRLDEETQGLCIYSKIPFFQPWLDKQLEEKKIQRQYLAICYGKCNIGDKFTFNQAIGRDRHNAKKFRISKTGKTAITKVQCIAKKGPYCLMQCDLETGRTHQIRIHLSYAGFPIVNDPLYGKKSKDFKDMGLYAWNITFHNPISKKKHSIQDKTIHVKEIFGI